MEGFMKNFKKMLCILVFSISLASCSNSLLGSCPDGEIDWMDVVMIDDIQYQHQFPDSADGSVPISIEKGRKLGEVVYKMADSACSNHQMENGDATFLEEGTSIYELKGYPSDLMVIANDKVYVVDTNIKAKTAAELVPMRNLVENIHIESTEDGERIHTFTQPSKTKFLDTWNQLKLEDIESLYKDGKMDGKRLFLEIELKNGVAFRLIYAIDSNRFNNGAIGNEKIKDVIESEITDIQKESLFDQ